MAIAMVAIASCTNEVLLTPEPGVDESAARDLMPMSFSTGYATRTSLDGNVVNWTEDDEIVVFDDLHYLNKFGAKSVDGAFAVFEGMVTARTTDFYAVYPYSSAIKATDESICVNLIDNQTPVAGTFAEEHNISIAHATKAAEDDHVDNVLFRNLCGLVQFTVPERLNAVASVEFIANSRNIAGDLTVAKDDMSITAYENAARTVYMNGSFDAGSTFYFVVTPGEINGFNIKVTAENGATYTKSSAKTINIEAGKIRNLGVIDFAAQPTATAWHTYEGGVLTGTAVTLQLGLPAGMEEYVDGLSASLVNSNGQELRILKKTSGVTTSEEMSVAYASAYIPTGTYKIFVTYSLNGVPKEETIYVDVPRPEFSVTADAYTSYSKYREGDLYAANYKCKPETVYGMKCSVNISDAVLKQYGLSSCSVYLTDPYGTGLPLYGTVNKNSSSCFYMEQQSVSARGQYSMSAEVTFDGVTKSSPPKTLHITGLPYKAPSMVESDWELASWNCKYSNGSIQLGGVSGSGECTATSKMAFVIPNNVNIKVNTNVTIRAFNFGLWYNTDFTVKVNGTQIIKQNSDKQDNNNTGKNYNLSGNATFTPSGCSVVMNSSYTAAGPWSKIHSMEILYR